MALTPPGAPETLPIPIALYIAKTLRVPQEQTEPSGQTVRRQPDEYVPLRDFKEVAKLSSPYGGPTPYEINVGAVIVEALED